MRKICLLTTLAATCALSHSAHAGGIATARFGGEHGHPMTSNPSAIYYNPAGIATSDGINIMADGTMAWRSVRFTPANPLLDDPTIPAGIGANTSKANLFNIAGAPMLGATARFGLTDRIGLAAGAAFFVPFGGGTRWGKNEDFRDHPSYAGPVDGSQRWYAIDGTLKSIYISGALGMSIDVGARFLDRISFGISGGPALNSVDTLRARDLTGGTNIEAEARTWLNVSGMQGHIGGGLMADVLENEKLRIGFSYQAPPGLGRMKLEGLLQKNTAGLVSGDRDPDDLVEYHQTLPDIFRFGISSRINKSFELRAFGDVQRWSLVDYQCVAPKGTPCVLNEDGSATDDKVIIGTPRNWVDTFGIRLGASYWLNPGIELFAGMGYDSNAVPDETIDPALFDMHDVGLSLGGKFALTQFLDAAVSYTQLFYIPRDTESRPASTNGTNGLKSPSIWPDASGRYEQMIGVLNINLQAHFDPFVSSEEPEPVEEIAPEPATDAGEEAPAEEEAAEEEKPAAEEAPAEEVPAEEKPAAEEAPAEEKPAAEEAPAEEKPDTTTDKDADAEPEKADDAEEPDQPKAGASKTDA